MVSFYLYFNIELLLYNNMGRSKVIDLFIARF